MKRLMVYLVAGSLGFFASVNVQAQDTTTAGQDIKVAANKTGSAVSKSAKKVGNKSAELATKGHSAVVDKKYDGKAGPNGETIYINDKSQYYYIDKKGHRQYLTQSQLKDKRS